MRFVTLILLFSLTGTIVAAPPEIAKVHPDTISGADSYAGLRVITGEYFDSDGLEVWTWEAPRSPELSKQAIVNLGKAPQALPETPPAGAKNITPVDVEKQVITTPLSGCVVWVKNKDGWSKPYLFDVARPLWISKATAVPGELLCMYGKGLQRGCNGSQGSALPRAAVVFQGANETRTVDVMPFVARAPRIADTSLVYFRVPNDLAPGPYAVWVHNNFKSDQYGWAKAGIVTIVSRPPEPRILNVREHGAKGNGLANDFPAIVAAMQAAKAAGGGVVFFEPGTYLVDETLRVPEGVTLRGASSRNTVIRGIGYPPVTVEGRPRAAALISLASKTGLESLCFEGAVAKGYNAISAWMNPKVNPDITGQDAAMIRVDEHIGEKANQTWPPRDIPPVAEVRITRCVIAAEDETVDGRDYVYPYSLWLWHARQVTISNNDIWGTVTLYWGNRVDFIENVLHKAWTGPQSINMVLEDSLIDSNLFTDDSARLCMYPSQNTCIRLNVCDPRYRGMWVNAPESFLQHCWPHTKVVSTATGASATTLADTTQKWVPGSRRGQTVAIVAGRGMGQYRRVLDNTETTITLDTPWTVEPDTRSTYVLEFMNVSNTWYGNLNNSGGTSFFFFHDALDCLVQNHRDVAPSINGHGIQVYAIDDSGWNEDKSAVKWGYNGAKLGLMWYNLFTDIDLGGRSIDLWMNSPIWCYYRDANEALGNIFSGISGISSFTAGMQGTAPRKTMSHTIIQGCGISGKLTVMPAAYKTFIDASKLPTGCVVDNGFRTGLRTRWAGTYAVSEKMYDAWSWYRPPLFQPENGRAALMATPGNPTLDKAAWDARHAEITAALATPTDLVFFGDGLTEGWSTKGKAAWEQLTAGKTAVNAGITGDLTQSLLWRLANGELNKKISPSVVVLEIGSENLAHGDKPDDVADAIQNIIGQLQMGWPGVKVLLMSSAGKNSAALNARLQRLDDGERVLFRDAKAGDYAARVQAIVQDVQHGLPVK